MEGEWEFFGDWSGQVTGAESQGAGALCMLPGGWGRGVVGREGWAGSPLANSFQLASHLVPAQKVLCCEFLVIDGAGMWPWWLVLCAHGVLSEILWSCAWGCHLQGAYVEVQALGAGQQGRSDRCQWPGTQQAGTGWAMDIHWVWRWPAGWEDLVTLTGLEVQDGGQGAPCAPQGLGLVATIQFWSGFPLHAPTTC